MMPTYPAVVDLNVGGVFYTTALSTLTAEPDSLLAEIFTGRTDQLSKDSQVKSNICFFNFRAIVKRKSCRNA